MPAFSLSQSERIRQGDVAYVSLWVPDLERAMRFYERVLGWRYAPGNAAEGRQVTGISPSHGLSGGHERSTLFLCFAVDDLAAATEQVRALGGTAGPLVEREYGTISDCVDDQGTAFALYQAPTDVEVARPPVNGARQGDLAYITVGVHDTARARAFYGALLGWRFTPGQVQDGWQVENVAPMAGLWGGGQEPRVVPMYLVDEIHDAAGRVRAAGGTSTEPEQQPYGISAECTDDQGTRFYLGRL